MVTRQHRGSNWPVLLCQNVLHDAKFSRGHMLPPIGYTAHPHTRDFPVSLYMTPMCWSGTWPRTSRGLSVPNKRKIHDFASQALARVSLLGTASMSCWFTVKAVITLILLRQSVMLWWTCRIQVWPRTLTHGYSMSMMGPLTVGLLLTLFCFCHSVPHEPFLQGWHSLFTLWPPLTPADLVMTTPLDRRVLSPSPLLPALLCFLVLPLLSPGLRDWLQIRGNLACKHTAQPKLACLIDLLCGPEM